MFLFNSPSLSESANLSKDSLNHSPKFILKNEDFKKFKIPRQKISNNVKLLSFTDNDLQALLKSQSQQKKSKGLVLYQWTPYMPLSYYGIASIKKAAQKLDLKVFLLVDAKAAKEDILYVAQNLSIKPTELHLNFSQELNQRGMNLHFPSAIYTYLGQISSRRYPGYKPQSVYESWMRFEIDKMKQETKNLKLPVIARYPNYHSAQNEREIVRENLKKKSKLLKSTSNSNSNSNFNSQTVKCDTSDFSVQKEYLFPHFGYWMKPLGDRYITYTSIGGEDAKIFDLQLSKKLYFSSGLDPFPTQDALYYVHSNPIRFLIPEEGIKRGDDAEPVFVDEDLKGTYQSIGMLQDTPQKKVYRILIGGMQSVEIQDYIRLNSKKQDSNPDNIEFAKKFSTPQKICENVNPQNITISTPVLSNQGQLMGGQDYVSQTTKIFSFDPEVQTCKPIADIGIATNKVTFSWDDQWVAYIKEGEVNKSSESTAEELPHKQLYIFDIKEQKSYLISTPVEDPNYQAFRKDHTIMYTRVLDQNPQLYPPGTTKLVFLDTQELIPKIKKPSAAQILVGYLWGGNCQQEQISLNEATVVGARLLKDTCLKMISQPEVLKEFQDKIPAEMGEFKEPELRAYCNSL